MAKLKYYGVHGTCISAAKSIIANGMRAALVGRAGSGAYLWSYATDDSYAEELARDWYQDQADKGGFDTQPERGLAVLWFEIELESHEHLNINSTWHHETIRRNAARATDKVQISKVFDDHFRGVSEYRLQKFGSPLKVVEALVPFPQTTKDTRRGGTPLTTGGDAYIVLQPGLSALRVVSAKGVNFKG